MIQIKARSHSSINFKNAIQLREKQFGCQNTANALTYCKYSRQLAESKQFK